MLMATFAASNFLSVNGTKQGSTAGLWPGQYIMIVANP